jgi:uncharacterized protein (TIGR00255 family)
MSARIQSMTGFGSAEGTVGPLRLAVEVRSVNHRFFTPSIKLPQALTRLEPEVRELLRQRVTRGHVTLAVRVERDAADGPQINLARLSAYAEQLRAFPADASGAIDTRIDLAALLRLPDVITMASSDDAALTTLEPAPVLQLIGDAVTAFVAMRAEEGGRLVNYLLDRLASVEQALGRIAVRAPERLVAQRDRLAAAVQELAGGVALDPQRLAQEIAVLADRLDVSEELSRFSSHNQAFRDALAGGAPDGVGKRLGFILQEMVREANTTGSKANDAAMQREVVLIKEELERMREQVENLE